MHLLFFYKTHSFTENLTHGETKIPLPRGQGVLWVQTTMEFVKKEGVEVS